MVTVGEICNREVVVATRDTTVVDAARLMRNYHVGTLVVVEHGDVDRRPVGIVTDRDLVVEIMAIDIDPNDMTVGEIMAPALVIARESDDIRKALECMRHNGMRRLPITGARGQLVGIVAADDLIKILADDMAALATIPTREHSREAAQRRPLVELTPGGGR